MQDSNLRPLGYNPIRALPTELISQECRSFPAVSTRIFCPLSGWRQLKDLHPQTVPGHGFQDRCNAVLPSWRVFGAAPPQNRPGPNEL